MYSSGVLGAESLASRALQRLRLCLTYSHLPRIHGADERIAIDGFVEIIRFYVQSWWNTLSDSGE